MADDRIPTREQVEGYLHDRRNWKRWGDKSAAGAINLITPQKRIDAAKLVRSGRALSLSRPLPVAPAPNNPKPVQHYTHTLELPDEGGGALDYMGIYQHGFSVTHLDALCHAWDKHGMWDGKDPKEEISFDGGRYGSIDVWQDGIMTRGVLLNVPKHRGNPYVTFDSPVHGWELEEIAAAQHVTIEPGDAVLLYSGLEAYDRDGGQYGSDMSHIPGVHASCLPFIRDHDVALWCWDMTEMMPNGYGLAWSIHGILYSYGVALIDNAFLEPLAQACEEEGRFEFLFTVNPLVLVGGTGSPVNPVVVF